MGNDKDYRKQVGINYHPMTHIKRGHGLQPGLNIEGWANAKKSFRIWSYCRSN